MMAMDTRELILLCTLVGVVMVIIGVIGPVIIFVLSKNQKQLQKKSMEAEKIESMFKNGKITQEEAAELKKAIGLKALVPGMTPKDKHIRILSYAEILVAALAFLFLSIILIVLLTVHNVQITYPDFPGIDVGSPGMLILSILGLCIVLRLWAAFKLRKGSKAARITILIFSIVDLLSFPIGTAVGIYAFWVLVFREGAEEYYKILEEGNCGSTASNNGYR